MPEYRDLVEYIVRSLVDHPEAVDVSESGRGRSPRIEVRLHPEDVGRVIGKSGRNIEAVRALVKAAAIRDHRRVSVEVVTDDDDERASRDRDSAGSSAPGGEFDAQPGSLAARDDAVAEEDPAAGVATPQPAAASTPEAELMTPAPAGAGQEAEPEQ